ncbi:MFS transporter [Amycolatopsis rubida]|uniref:MFS transporter n=1 Tax=Amycolatopsis rubida TaxID=112413 RepID=A0ABX0BT61_9PSEU|nr:MULTISPECIES: hypothetical protein [Amycolatopsis]MYW93738.1 hypothetical protein [Amycolatopsis rubida]NEC58725.1 MFS transporter [Amycolatopsis rubida]OAP22920.1 hypothetical protein A4R44_06382 [Amycolatopsis sp. M39]
MLADVVYENARDLTDPCLAPFGASAATVGAGVSAEETAARAVRLFSAQFWIYR